MLGLQCQRDPVTVKRWAPVTAARRSLCLVHSSTGPCLWVWVSPPRGTGPFPGLSDYPVKVRGERRAGRAARGVGKCPEATPGCFSPKPSSSYKFID